MWPPPGSLTQDFWLASLAAVVYCAAALSLSHYASGRVVGKVYLDLSPAHRRLWHSYVYCLLPGTICWLLISKDLLHMLMVTGWNADHVLTVAPSQGVMRAVGWELGFLAFDLGRMIKCREFLMEAMTPAMYWQMFAHHALSLICWPQAIVRQSGIGLITYFVSTEVTSLFINVRWLLVSCNMEDHFAYLLNGSMLVISFVLIRVVPIPWSLWVLWTASKSSFTWLEVVLLYATVPIPAVLNLYWFTMVIQGVITALSPRPNSPAELTEMLIDKPALRRRLFPGLQTAAL